MNNLDEYMMDDIIGYMRCDDVMKLPIGAKSKKVNIFGYEYLLEDILNRMEIGIDICDGYCQIRCKISESREYISVYVGYGRITKYDKIELIDFLNAYDIRYMISYCKAMHKFYL